MKDEDGAGVSVLDGLEEDGEEEIVEEDALSASCAGSAEVGDGMLESG